jgi:hypothetical protein
MKYLASGILLFALVACSPEYGKGFRASDAEYMSLFLTQLDRYAIAYKVDQTGMVYYKSADEKKVEEIHEKVKARLALASSLKFEEDPAREYLKALLQKKGLEYSVEERADGTWIRWYPESEEQEHEVQMAVVQHIFAVKAGRK